MEKKSGNTIPALGTIGQVSTMPANSPAIRMMVMKPSDWEALSQSRGCHSKRAKESLIVQDPAKLCRSLQVHP